MVLQFQNFNQLIQFIIKELKIEDECLTNDQKKAICKKFAYERKRKQKIDENIFLEQNEYIESI